MRNRLSGWATGLALAASVAACPAVQAQPPLDGALTIVVGYPPGGSSDRVARLVADRLKERIGARWWSRTRPGPAAASPPRACMRPGRRRTC